jgi:hypothetical protein
VNLRTAVPELLIGSRHESEADFRRCSIAYRECVFLPERRCTITITTTIATAGGETAEAHPRYHPQLPDHSDDGEIHASLN